MRIVQFFTCKILLYNYFLEPQSGFRIAFNMFDTDGNEKVDKNEFLVVSTLIVGYLMSDPNYRYSGHTLLLFFTMKL